MTDKWDEQAKRIASENDHNVIEGWVAAALRDLADRAEIAESERDAAIEALQQVRSSHARA